MSTELSSAEIAAQHSAAEIAAQHIAAELIAQHTADDVDAHIVSLIVEAYEGHTAGIAALHYASEDFHECQHRQTKFSISHDLTMKIER